MQENRRGISPGEFRKRLQHIIEDGVTPLENTKRGIQDYTSHNEMEDLKRYKGFLNTSSYDEVRDVKVPPPYQGEEI